MNESQSIELKSNWRDEYLRQLCGFANTNGGIMYVGLGDNGNPVELKNVKKLLEDIPNKIKNHLNIMASVEIENVKGINVIKVSINPSDVPMSYNGKFYVRVGSTTQELSGTELAKFILKKQNLSFDSLLQEAGIGEIDEETLKLFKGLAKNRINISEDDTNEKILENLELFKNGKLTNAGVLLFGKNPQKYIISAGARVGRFKTPTTILDTVDVSGNLFTQLEGLTAAIKKHLNVKFEIKGIERTDIWDYPPEAIREAAINALIHRDYLDTADIQIKIYDDKIWFWNAGKLPEGLTVEMLKGEHGSKPHNKLLAMVFYYAGLIEKWGSGTKRMVELCKEQGLPEPEFKEEFGGLSVYFYKDIYTEENLRKIGLNERQIKVVMYVKENGDINLSSFSKLVSDVSSKTLYRDLQDLVNRGIFKEVGEKKGRKYELAK